MYAIKGAESIHGGVKDMAKVIYIKANTHDETQSFSMAVASAFMTSYQESHRSS